MTARFRAVRTIVGAWGVQTSKGPLVDVYGVPMLFPAKQEAQRFCQLDDMRPVRVTVRYPRLAPTRR